MDHGLIPDAGTQQQEEQQGLVEEWARDSAAMFALLLSHPALPIHEPEHNMVAFSSMSTSKYLKKEDIPKPELWTIKSFRKENVAQEDSEPEHKWVLYFEESEKGLVLNSTNRAILEKNFGPDSDDCLGRRIVIEVDENVSYGGKLVGGLRLRMPKRKAAPQAPPPIDEIDESDIPF